MLHKQQSQGDFERKSKKVFSTFKKEHRDIVKRNPVGLKREFEENTAINKMVVNLKNASAGRDIVKDNMPQKEKTVKMILNGLDPIC